MSVPERSIDLKMFFESFDFRLPSAQEILSQCSWEIEPYNASFLAGKTPEQKPGKFVELTDTQIRGTAPRAELPKEWSHADKLNVIGDISHTLALGTDFIIVETSRFKSAGIIARELNYRPALAGEYIQLLRWLVINREHYLGYFYCYAGRVPGYAICATYNGLRNPPDLHIVFDTYKGNEIADGWVNANMTTYAFFVKNKNRIQ